MRDEYMKNVLMNSEIKTDIVEYCIYILEKKWKFGERGGRIGEFRREGREKGREIYMARRSRRVRG